MLPLLPRCGRARARVSTLPHAFHAVAFAFPGFVRVGPLRLPVFGLVATAGLVLAMLLSQRTAVQVSLAPERIWDAGVVAVAAAFLISRLLLIVVNFRLFLRRPIFVLGQPSLTAGSLAVAGLILWWWMQRSGVPWRGLLDAWAAPAALLAAVLQAGHFVEGTDNGMPTKLPWGVALPGGPAGQSVHPVQLYAAAAYLVLGGFLFWRGATRAHRRPGQLAAVCLTAGGVLSFWLGMLRQPVDPLGGRWLDPGQWLALAFMAAGAVLWAFTSGAHHARAPLQLSEESR